MSLNVKRHDVLISPIHNRVLIRPFVPGKKERVASIAERVLALPEPEVERVLQDVREEFSKRHFDIETVFRQQFEKVRGKLPPSPKLTSARRLLLGSYFTSEYALESAALFNPSLVPHPDQTGLDRGAARFVMSLRATGEGHISSIEFRSGVIDASGEVSLDPPGHYVKEPDLVADPYYDRALFRRKLEEMSVRTDLSERILTKLPESFTRSELFVELEKSQRNGDGLNQEESGTLDAMSWLAESNYEVTFSGEEPLSERIIFPVSNNESNGIEDARFVRFVADDGEVRYYATYTAYNGRTILPQMLETTDFCRFHIRTLNGDAVQNKGMALFPRRIDGHYMMVGRQDNENLFLMSSDHPHFWFDAEKLIGPKYPWEFVQIGNCGSPIETEEGWLLLTHGVGTMRKYCLGAVLLDLKDPSKVIGRLREPLLEPDENEREGYVPNVVYTCGAMLHGAELIIPYAMSDYASRVASVKLTDLLAAMSPP